MEQQKKLERFYSPQLDGLRFFAFLLVFIHNAPHDTGNPIWIVLDEFGWIGVDLFFALSAFLLARLLTLEYKTNQTIDASKFYTRRALRIIPLYFFYIIVVAGTIALKQSAEETLFIQTISLMTFTYNLAFIFFIKTAITPLFHLWTISFEEQFYLLLPFITKKLFTLSKKSKIMILVLFFLFGNVVRAILIALQVEHPVIYMLPLTRFESLLGGFILGLGIIKIPSKNTTRLFLFLLGLLCHYLVTLLPDVSNIGWNLMLSYPLVGLGMSLIVSSVIDTENPIFGFVLKNKVLVSLGKISYGLYIYHLVCVKFAIYLITNLGVSLYRTPLLPIAIFILGFCITILVASVSYIIIEKPFLLLKTRYSLVTSRPVYKEKAT